MQLILNFLTNNRLKTQAKLKGGLSNTKALRKEKIKKDNYANDNVLKVSDDIKNLLSK